MVFSSIGDTTRVSPLQNPDRCGLLATHPLLRSAVSGTGTLAQSSSTTVWPVSLHSSTRRLPGFNQAELIAHGALKGRDHELFQLVTNVTERVKPTSSQIGLTRSHHQEKLRGACQVRHLSRARGGDILVVDDLITTAAHPPSDASVFCAGTGREEPVGSNCRKNVEEFYRTKPGRGEMNMQVAVSQ